MSGKRKLKVDLDELAVALDSSSLGTHYYLDLETGRVVMVTKETRRELSEILDMICDQDGDRAVSLEEHLQERDDLREWVKENLREGDLVTQEHGTRFISVEPETSHPAYQDVARFIATVEDKSIHDRLRRAIRARRSSRRSRDLLDDYPDLRDRWFEFKATQTRQRTVDWLRDHGIEPIFPDAPE